MAGIPWADFKGSVLGRDPELLAPNFAAEATGADVRRGDLAAFRRPLRLQSLANPGTLKTLFRMFNGSTNYWLAWSSVVHAVRGPIANDTAFRTYYTGDVSPRKTNLTLATSGSPYPFDYLELGIPKPPDFSVAAVGGSGAAETRAYRVTFVTSWGEESQPSNAISASGFVNSASWSLTGLPVAPVGKYDVTHKRIYRTATGNDGVTLYLRVAEIAIATTSYSDTVAVAALGNELTTEGWIEPPADLRCLSSGDDGVAWGVGAKQVVGCEPYQWHAWPTAYRYAMPFNPIGLGVMPGMVVVVTDGAPQIGSGAHPAVMSWQNTRAPYPGASDRAICTLPFGVLYASPRGLILVDGGGVTNVTEPFMNERQWQAFNPSSMVFVPWLDSVLAFYTLADGITKRSLLLNPKSQRMPVMPLTEWADAAYTDFTNTNVYIVQSSSLYLWDGDENNKRNFDWKSSVAKLRAPANMRVAKVEADYRPLFNPDFDAAAEAAAADAAFNTAILAGTDNHPLVANTRGPLGQQYWGELMWGSSLLREDAATYESRGLAFELYANDEKTSNELFLVHSESNLMSPEPFTLPDGYRADKFQIRIFGNLDVKAVKIAGSPEELKRL